MSLVAHNWAQESDQANDEWPFEPRSGYVLQPRGCRFGYP